MILEKFGYVKGEQFSYLSKRVCGLLLPLALLISINALAGMWMPSVSFSVFAYLDVVIKALFGLNLLISKNPLSINNEESKASSIYT